MEMFSPEQIRGLLLFIPPFIICLCLHEYAHAWVADKLGDSTARYMGRLTLDPMAHMSWLGTVIFPAIGFLTGAPLFGWANPVPVDMRNFKNPRRGMAIVAVAGPLSNVILAVFSVAALALVLRASGQPSLALLTKTPGMLGSGAQMLSMAVLVNLFLAVFNMIPIPPLDGSRVLQAVVGPRAADAMDRHAGMAQLLLFAVILTGFGRILAVPVYAALGVLFHLFGIGM